MLIPIRDHNPSSRRPYVCWLLIVANTLIFAWYMPLFGDPRALFAFFSEWALIPARLSEGGSAHPLLTSMFLHGSAVHLGLNMLFLWIFGDNLEDNMGHFGFLAFYLTCGVGAALVHLAADPGSTIPMVGASGAIAGVMGGYLLLYPRARVDILLFLIVYIRIIPVAAWLMLAVWFVIQIVGGLTSDPGTGGIAYWAHAGGFVVGAILTVPVWLRRGGRQYWKVTKGVPPNPEATYRFVRTGVPAVPRDTGSGTAGDDTSGGTAGSRAAAPARTPVQRLRGGGADGLASRSRVPTVRRNGQ